LASLKSKNKQLILCLLALSVAVFSNFHIISVPRNHKSKLRNDHNNKINVSPLHAAPSILIKLYGTKAK